MKAVGVFCSLAMVTMALAIHLLNYHRRSQQLFSRRNRANTMPDHSTVLSVVIRRKRRFTRLADEVSAEYTITMTMRDSFRQ